MVSLSLMARLVEAVRPGARLILVGDPGQLTSIEAGAVLGDIAAAGDAVVVLDEVYRYDERIGRLAAAIREGDADATVAAPRRGHLDRRPRGFARAAARARRWRPPARSPPRPRAATARGRWPRCGASGCCARTAAARYGVSGWTARIEEWTGAGGGDWYVGRPLLVTENDYWLQLFNGDTGVVIAERARRGDGRVRARRGQPDPACRGRDRVRDDRPQGTGLAVRHGGGGPARPELADPHARAALHRRHARPRAS